MPCSGFALLKEFEKAGWATIRQRGSHVILHKGPVVAVIPMHKELKKGMECALRKQRNERKL